ncbi:hypothetical protein GCM10023086_01950 [Streptomyces venetus]|uniref:GYD domain-containing protein n=1 Tax=Streptomyces venetus TaxID=1701086 RepID=A0ABP8F171_9ACTN
MSKYLFKSRLTPDGMKGLLSEGAKARREAVGRMVEDLGGRVEAMYWAFGDEDVYVTAELPGNTSAAAMGMVVSSVGGVRTTTVVLLSADEIDEAVRQEVHYRPPGG